MRVPRRWRDKLRTSSGREILAGGARRVHRRYHKQAEVAAKNPPRRILRRLFIRFSLPAASRKIASRNPVNSLGRRGTACPASGW